MSDVSPGGLPPPPDLPAPPTIDHPAVDPIQEIVEGDDPIAVEGGRDLVQRHHLPILARAYWATDSWAERLNIIEITMDHTAAELAEVASDFLRAPEPIGDERVELGKAIALGHLGQELDEDLDTYVDYLNDRTLLRRRVDETLELLGLDREPTPPSAPTPELPPLAGHPDRRLTDAILANRDDEFRRALDDGADAATVIDQGDWVTVSAAMACCIQRRYDWAAELVERGADVNHLRTGPRPQRRDRGQTMVWWAANHGRLDMVEWLAERGADIDQPDSWGATPLHEAASGGHLDVARWLVDHGADTDARISDGRTPFNLAATHGRTELVRFFVDLGHPPDQTGGAGYTALMLACENGKIEMADALLDAGAAINRRHPGEGIYAGLRGWTPLVFCVRGGRIKITRRLIERGANVDEIIAPASPHADEQRVIHFCHGRQATKLRDLLIEAGANPA